MTGNKFIAILAAMVAIGAALAVAGLYIDWQRMFAPPAVERGPIAGQGDATAPVEPQAAGPAEEPETKPSEATDALTPPAELTSVPTFDVVVIEPSGEGVIAGRGAPGWKVSVQSGGMKVAEAKADLQGEWSVVLEKPLEAGDHALSLKIISPDGTRALSSQETVRVAVGTEAKRATTQTGAEQAAVPPVSAPQATAAEPANVASQPPPQAETAAMPLASEPDSARALARAEQSATPTEAQSAAPSKPKLVFKTMDYQHSGSGTGTVTITGTSEPGARIAIYYGNERLAEARADRDGQWRVAVAKTLSMGQHSFRAERAGAGAGMAGTALVTIERVEPKAEPPPAAVAAKLAGQGSQVAAAEGANDQASKEGPKFYVIQRGDTLWAIAKRYLGSGLRYTSIFQDNRTIIRNPDLIHPKQEVKVPSQ